MAFVGGRAIGVSPRGVLLAGMPARFGECFLDEAPVVAVGGLARLSCGDVSDVAVIGPP